MTNVNALYTSGVIGKKQAAIMSMIECGFTVESATNLIEQCLIEIGTNPRKSTRWSKDEDQYLSVAYPSGVSIKEMSMHLGRSEGTIRLRAHTMKLHRPKREVGQQ